MKTNEEEKRILKILPKKKTRIKVRTKKNPKRPVLIFNILNRSIVKRVSILNHFSGISKVSKKEKSTVG